MSSPERAAGNRSGVLRAARQYHALVERLRSGKPCAELERLADIAALGSRLADEYTGTGLALVTRDEELDACQTSRTSLRSPEYLDQHVRTIGNGVAVETGKLTYIDTNAAVPVVTTQRYTRTWALFDGRWQITASHVSLLTK